MRGRLTAADIQAAFPYTSTELTGAINLAARQPMKIDAMGVFRREPISTTLVEITISNGEVVILPITERGAPGTWDGSDDVKKLFVECAHIPHLATVNPDDIQNFLDIQNGQQVRRTVEGEVARRLQKFRVKFDLTREYMEMSTLKGVWKDGKGRTVMNWYEFFGVNPKQIAFNLGSDTTDLVAKTDELSNYIFENLTDDTSDGICVLVDRDFYNKFVQHPKYEKYFDKTDAMNRLANMPYSVQGGVRGRRTVFQGVIFEEYNAQVTRFDKDGAGVRVKEKMVATGRGHAFPTGTQDTFISYEGSPYSVNAANGDGEFIYVTREDLKHEMGVELKGQANPLVMCKRPGALVEITQAANFN